MSRWGATAEVPGEDDIHTATPWLLSEAFFEAVVGPLGSTTA
jgi:hypothetical protein